MGKCRWFLMCENEAVGLVAHPVLHYVPTCQRCADKFGLKVEDVYVETKKHFSINVGPYTVPSFYVEPCGMTPDGYYVPMMFLPDLLLDGRVMVHDDDGRNPDLAFDIYGYDDDDQERNLDYIESLIYNYGE